ncbi:motile sperm domain-containing protein 2-like [Ornithodoros turicata]|uniref:motile sperm domain-containing protein 2-like n=1 Tax=Ornithodoros turicata TaxID=34597 RepID=UPI00313863BC
MQLIRGGDSGPEWTNLVKIEPEEIIYLDKGEVETGSCPAGVSIENRSNRHVTFKIKTNNIEAYRVKPFFGIVRPRTTFNIKVDRNPGSVVFPTDKVLILTAPIEEIQMSPKELLDHWKTIAKNSTSIREHKLRVLNHSASPSTPIPTQIEDQSLRPLPIKSTLAREPNALRPESSVPLGPCGQDLPREQSTLDIIQEGFAELEKTLEEMRTEVRSTSQNVKQIWFVVGGSTLGLLIFLLLAILVQTCLSSTEWYC